MAGKRLDVDVLAPEPDVFVFEGREYPMGDLSTCRWEDQDRFQEIKAGMPRAEVQKRVAAVTGLPMDVLDRLKLPQFQKVVEHCIAPLVAAAREASQQEAAQEKPEPASPPNPSSDSASAPALPAGTGGLSTPSGA